MPEMRQIFFQGYIQQMAENLVKWNTDQSNLFDLEKSRSCKDQGLYEPTIFEVPEADLNESVIGIQAVELEGPSTPNTTTPLPASAKKPPSGICYFEVT